MRELSRLEYSSSEDKTNIVLFFGCASEQFNISFILLAIVLYPIHSRSSCLCLHVHTYIWHWSRIAGWYWSTVAGWYWPTGAGWYLSPVAGWYWLTAAGWHWSKVAGGCWSTIAGRYWWTVGDCWSWITYSVLCLFLIFYYLYPNQVHPAPEQWLYCISPVTVNGVREPSVPFSGPSPSISLGSLNAWSH